MSVPYEKIVQEDIDWGIAQVTVTMPAGGTATGRQVNPASFPALAFSAVGLGTQSLSASTLTTVELPTEEFDTVSWFNNGTYAFTPLKAGYYQFNAEIALASFSGSLTLGLYKNGSLVTSSDTIRAGNTGRVSISALIRANGTTDTFVIKATQTDASAKTITATRFSGACIGGL